jgi:hypothetical protein
MVSFKKDTCTYDMKMIHMYAGKNNIDVKNGVV